MRTTAAVLGLVGMIMVVTDLRARTGMDSALGPRPSAAPCQPGSPTRMSIPALEVDAPIETIGLDRHARPDSADQAPLGAPVDPRKAGWYAAGPKPGSGLGTVLTNGHTYRDGSAIFQQDFAARVAPGQQIDLVIDNGTTSTTNLRHMAQCRRGQGLPEPRRQRAPLRPAGLRAALPCDMRRPLGQKRPDVQGHQCRPGHPRRFLVAQRSAALETALTSNRRDEDDLEHGTRATAQ